MERAYTLVASLVQAAITKGSDHPKLYDSPSGASNVCQRRNLSARSLDLENVAGDSLKLEMSSEPAPARGSGNITLWEEYVDIAFLAANSFILLVTSFVGIAANLFVTWAVHHQKSLQTWNNALLVNLAVIDILRCAVDCPILLAIVMTVRQRGHVDEFICDAHVASFSFSCCIQLLTLACISVERYQAIAQPSKTSQRRRRIIVLIPLTWTVAILVAVFCMIFVKDSPVYVKCHGSQWETTRSYDTFGLYMLAPLWTTCFGVIIGFYARIFALVRAHGRKIFDKGVVPLSKKDKTKKADEQKTVDATGGDNGHNKSDQIQIQEEAVAQVERATQAEPNPPNRDSAAALLNPTAERQSASNGSENKEQCKATANITEVGIDRPRPPVMQVELNSSNKDTGAGLKSLLTEPQRISKHGPEAQVQIGDVHSGMDQPNPRAVQVKPTSPKGDTVTRLRSSTTEPKRVSNNLDTQSQSKATVQRDEAPSETDRPKPRATQVQTKSLNGGTIISLRSSTAVSQRGLSNVDNQSQAKAKEQSDVAPSETEKTCPDVSPAPQLDKPEALPVATADQDCSLAVPQVSNVPDSGAAEQTPEVDGAVCMMPSFANKERATKKKESKMAKRSGYIILTYLFFWLPLITTIVVNFFVRKNRSARMRFVQDVEVLAVSVACMTSLSDPIIYAAVNPQFRTEFYRLKNRLKSSCNKK